MLRKPKFDPAEGTEADRREDAGMPYMGFDAVEKGAAEHGARNPGAVAAAIGRKKYGGKAMSRASAIGRKRGHGAAASFIKSLNRG